MSNTFEEALCPCGCVSGCAFSMRNMPVEVLFFEAACPDADDDGFFMEAAFVDYDAARNVVAVVTRHGRTWVEPSSVYLHETPSGQRDLRVGDACEARHAADAAWYRGRVSARTPTGYRVHFPLYGESAYYDVCDVRVPRCRAVTEQQ